MDGHTDIFWAMIFGAIGSGYFLYGKKQRNLFALGCGIGLVIFPWFVSGAWLTFLIGAVLTAIPWFFR
jgi:hypothetical protein